MRRKGETRSVVVGLLIGLAFSCVLGAAANSKGETYQLSMAANDHYVYFGRIHTTSGRVEMWKYSVHAGYAIPTQEDNRNRTIRPGIVELGHATD